MKQIAKVLFALLVGLCGLITPAIAQYQAEAPEPIAKIKGALLLHGGGELDPSIRKRFIQLAGDQEARIVLIPTADGTDPLDESKKEPWTSLGATNVEILHAATREEALDPAFAEKLASATAVWIGGGNQERLEEIYIDTPVENAIAQVLERGGVVGGSSAGAAIASRVMISQATEHRGLDLLPGSIVDQHFTERNRQERLFSMVKKHLDRFGVGIDERTALIVRGRRMQVMGPGKVTLYLAPSATKPERIDQLSNGDVADIIALNRSAIARTQPSFPPAESPLPNVPKGTLVIVGGGGLPKGLMQRFVELAGGSEAKIVYIPCVEEEVVEQDRFVDVLQSAGAKSVVLLHTKDRKKANEDEEFLRPLKEATGVWFGGGRQWNLVDSYQNRQAHLYMEQVLERGGVIGGSSAGASIQGDYMPRGDPLGNLNIIAEGYETGLGFLRGVGIDQHFAQRNRFPDMSLLIKTYPQLLGIGIDETTAIVVQGHIAEVTGRGNVAFYDSKNNQVPVDPNDPTAGTRDYISVPDGGRYDLQARKVIASGEK